MDFLVSLFNEIHECGVNKIVITDTVGIMLPSKMKQFMSEIKEKCYQDIQYGVHCHNDFGLATANTLAAIEAGAIYPTVTVNGIGERAGNASLEEIVLALEVLYKCNTGIDLKRIMELSDLVETITGFPISPNKAVVGFNAFRHESGLHVNSLLRSSRTYEPFPPEIIGRKHEFVFGKHCGRSLLRELLFNEFDNEDVTETVLETIKCLRTNVKEKRAFVKCLHSYYKHYLGISEEEVLRLVTKGVGCR